MVNCIENSFNKIVNEVEGSRCEPAVKGSVKQCVTAGEKNVSESILTNMVNVVINFIENLINSLELAENRNKSIVFHAARKEGLTYKISWKYSEPRMFW